MFSSISKTLALGVCLFSSTWVVAAVREYQLTIDKNIVNVTGKPLVRMTVNGQMPAPLLEFEEGDEAVIHVKNNLKNEDTSVHWHGLLLPGIMDGVPGFNGFHGIKPQSEFIYRFKVRQSGTYWYHSHSKGQEQDGLYGPLVIYPKGKMPLTATETAQRDYVVMLSDFHESTSAQIMKNLKKSAEYYQDQRETVSDVYRQFKQQGFKNAWQDRRMWNQMRMLKTDMSDVTGYTFLLNGQTPAQNWTGRFANNEKIRLRFINASAMSFFDVRIPHLKMTVVAADGQPVQPVSVDEFRIGTAETYDVMVEPTADRYQIEAESIDRSGFAVGTLQNQKIQTEQAIEMPVARPRSVLTMEDMGGHAGMDHSKMSSMDHSKMSGMDHSKMSGMDHSKMTEMDHSKMSGMDNSKMSGMDHSKMSGMDHSKMSEMDHSKMSEMDHSKMTEMDHSKMSSMDNVHKAQSEQPPQGWANASTPSGYKALTYSDLKSLNPQKDNRTAERELVVHLGGTMERYIWTINGKKFTEMEPLQVKYGERIRLKFVNDSMMAHPMHLHGMFMQLENGQTNQDMPNKHTIVVPPGKTMTALLTADEIGEWAIHCHLLYHMSAGMMSKLIVAKVNDQVTAPSAQVMTEQGGHHAH